jgi:hypothetical protein
MTEVECGVGVKTRAESAIGCARKRDCAIVRMSVFPALSSHAHTPQTHPRLTPHVYPLYHGRRKVHRIRHPRLQRRLRVQDPALSGVHRRNHQEGAGSHVYAPHIHIHTAHPKLIKHCLAGFRENTQNRVDLPTIK